MWNRLLVAVITIPFLVYIYYHGGIPLLVFTIGVVGVGLREYYNMIEKSGQAVYKKIGLVAGVCVPIIFYMNANYSWKVTPFELIIFILLGLLGYGACKGAVENSTRTMGLTLFGIVYVAVFFSHILLISVLPNGGKWVFTIQALVWLCDSGAYFAGITLGRKFIKRGISAVSPKKSYEGAIGGTIITVVALLIINKIWCLLPSDVGVVETIIIGIIISIVIVVGDLIESVIKRDLNIKDSSRFLGEHGGILDRFDSMIYTLPIVYYLLKYFVV